MKEQLNNNIQIKPELIAKIKENMTKEVVRPSSTRDYPVPNKDTTHFFEEAYSQLENPEMSKEDFVALARKQVNMAILEEAGKKYN